MHGMDIKTKCVRLCVFMCNYAKPRYSLTISLTDVTSSPITPSTVLTVAGTNLRARRLEIEFQGSGKEQAR